MQYGQPQYSSAGLPTPPPAVSMIESPAKGKKQKDTDSNDKTGKSDKSSSGDYFGLLKRFSQDGVARWRNLPVRVRLPLNTPESWQHSLDLAIKRWGDHLPLKVVPASEPADVDVTWVNKLVPQYLGITRLVMSPAQMQVQIFLLRPTFYLPEIPEKVLANVFLHELGHGLGIFGHSDSKQDLMYAAEVVPGSKGKPAEIKYAGLSDRDVNTLKHVYALPPLPDGFSTSQPLEWGY
jgi:predicted Zn-dependent protease